MKKNLILTGWYYPEYLAAAAAEYIHNNSERKGVFRHYNCAYGGSDDMLMDRLFGHEKGAFTDAKEQRKGLFDIDRRTGVQFCSPEAFQFCSLQNSSFALRPTKEIPMLAFSPLILI